MISVNAARALSNSPVRRSISSAASRIRCRARIEPSGYVFTPSGFTYSRSLSTSDLAGVSIVTSLSCRSAASLAPRRPALSNGGRARISPRSPAMQNDLDHLAAGVALRIVRADLTHGAVVVQQHRQVAVLFDDLFKLRYEVAGRHRGRCDFIFRHDRPLSWMWRCRKSAHAARRRCEQAGAMNNASC